MAIEFGDTVKSMVKRQVVNDCLVMAVPRKQYTKKGLLLEDDIKAVGLLTGTLPVKNTERRNNPWIQR